MPSRALFQGPDGWWLAPEAAAIHLETKTAVIADVHLGYEWARGRGGDCVPAHSLVETIDQLQELFARAEVDTLIVAGDFVESRRFCRRTLHDLATLKSWLRDRGIELVTVAGNHDPPTRPLSPESLVVAGWTIAHGHRAPSGEKNMFGHHHPAIQAPGVKAPCFLVGPRRIVLPAFSRNAAGTGLETLRTVLRLDDDATRCIAAAGTELLDFGPTKALIAALGT